MSCSQADVTIDRIAALAAETGTEPLTVDFKENAIALETASRIQAVVMDGSGCQLASHP
jgi:hypothetical protein